MTARGVDRVSALGSDRLAAPAKGCIQGNDGKGLSQHLRRADRQGLDCGKPTLGCSGNVRLPDCCAQPGAGPQPQKNLVLKLRLTIYVHHLSNSTERQTSENTSKILFADNVIRAG